MLLCYQGSIKTGRRLGFRFARGPIHNERAVATSACREASPTSRRSWSLSVKPSDKLYSSSEGFTDELEELQLVRKLHQQAAGAGACWKASPTGCSFSSSLVKPSDELEKLQLVGKLRQQAGGATACRKALPTSCSYFSSSEGFTDELEKLQLVGKAFQRALAPTACGQSFPTSWSFFSLHAGSQEVPPNFGGSGRTPSVISDKEMGVFATHKFQRVNAENRVRR
ncbi:hypothetical protein PSTG_13856 [Puccinia striiformis f. sp. tritici PST-78]|uniref:Uncharacterized protein n=1 Tax=Puccinia striiformis f. sp. tritici PST-78 TaxID=1165861 RepID=A0A0L0V0L4_9BASI|nr:hypothetical protein PSTG_13856 [Puccinia striiformis f. sp. tritici PST-78]